MVLAKKFRSFVYLCDFVWKTNRFIYLFCFVVILLQWRRGRCRPTNFDLDKKRKKSGDKSGEFVLVFCWLTVRACERERLHVSFVLGSTYKLEIKREADLIAFDS